MCILIFFYCYCDHRNLHSFPTRRSSDLGTQGRRRHAPAAPGSGLLGTRALASQPRRVPRSEEHTSELQSQSNLVCRLLLEKKKQQNSIVVSYTTRLARLSSNRTRHSPFH